MSPLARIALETLAWLVTFALHSTILLSGALLFGAIIRREALRAVLWKTALVGAIATSTAQLLFGSAPIAGRLFFAAPPSQTAPPLRESRLMADNPLAGDPASPAQGNTPTSLRSASSLDDTWRDSEAASKFAWLYGANGQRADGRTLNRNIEQPPPAQQTPRSSSIAAATRWACTIIAAWIVVATFLLIRLAKRFRSLQTMLGARTTVADPYALATVASLARAAGLRRSPTITMSPRFESPIVLLTDEICLPPRFLRDLDPEEQRVALAHEVAHVARGDHLWLTMTAVLQAIFFFQPLHAIVRTRLRATTEVLADDWAVSQGGSHLVLARCLMRVAEWLTQEPRSETPFAVAMVASGSPLLRRIERLLAERREKAFSRAKSAAVAMSMLALVAWSAPQVSCNCRLSPQEGGRTGSAIPPGTQTLGATRDGDSVTSLQGDMMKVQASAIRCTTLFLVLTTACSADNSRLSGASTARDSAGVRIIEVEPGSWPPPEVWQVSAAPTVSIGVVGGNPDYELNSVQGAVGLADGGTVVAEFDARLRYYDAKGVHQRTVDRRGNGPGEAGAFSAFERYRGDSLLLTTEMMFASRGKSRTTFLVLAKDASFGRKVAVEYPAANRDIDSLIWINVTDGGVQAALGDGSFATVGATRASPSGLAAGDMMYGQSAVMRMNADGALVDSIAVFNTSAWEYKPNSPQRKYDFITGDPEGVAVRAHGNFLFHAEAERFQVDVFEARSTNIERAESGPSTRLVRSLRVRTPIQPYTAEAKREYVNDVVNTYSSTDPEREREAYRARLDSFKTPATVPVVQSLAIDATGNLWLELYSSPGAKSREFARDRDVDVEKGPSRWVVLSPEGQLLGSVLMPKGLQLFEIGATYVLGLWRDEMGVEFVRRYAIMK